MLRVRNVEGFNLIPHLSKLLKYWLSYSRPADLLDSFSKFSIISAGSPRVAHPKIVELYNHTAQASAYHACTEDSNLKRPYLPIIDGDS